MKPTRLGIVIALISALAPLGQMGYDVNQPTAQRVIDVHDIPGVDCTGGSSSARAFNALTNKQDSISFKIVSTRGCAFIRFDTQWLIQSQTNVLFDFAGTIIFGCNGSAVPLIQVQRSGYLTFDGGGTAKIWSSKNSCKGVFTGAFATANNARGGYTTTAIYFLNFGQLAPDPGLDGPAGWCGICTNGDANQENFRIENNYIAGNGSQGESKGIGILSGTAERARIVHNNLGTTFWGIYTVAPSTYIENNGGGGVGDWDVFPGVTTYGGTTYGAFVFCNNTSGLILKGNRTSEGSGDFLWTRNDRGGGACRTTLEGNFIQGDFVNVNCVTNHCNRNAGHHVPIGVPLIESGQSILSFTGGNHFDNETSPGINNTVPVVTTLASETAGTYYSFSDGDSGNISGSGILYDRTKAVNGLSVGASERGGQDVTTADQLQQSLHTAYYGNPPTKRWFAGGRSPNNFDWWATGVIDNNAQSEVGSSSDHLADQIVNRYGHPGSTVIQQPLAGGMVTHAAQSLDGLNPSASVQGGGLGTRWGYKICGVSTGGLTSCSSQFTVNGAAKVSSSHFNRITYLKPNDYSVMQLWLTQNPGDGRGIGMIANYAPLAANSMCTINTVQGCESAGSAYMQDTGQAMIMSGSPPVTTADGRVNIPSGATYQVNGSQISSSNLSDGPFTQVFKASLTSSAATFDKLSITGLTASSHCFLTATNSSAASNIGSTYISAKSTNQITITHAGTRGMTYDVLCTPN